MNKIIQREYIDKDYLVLKAKGDMSKFQDSILNNLVTLSRSTELFFRKVVSNVPDTLKIDTTNASSINFFENIKVSKLTYSSLLEEISHYEKEFSLKKIKRQEILLSIESKCREYQSKIDRKIDSVNNFFKVKVVDIIHSENNCKFIVEAIKKKHLLISDPVFVLVFKNYVKDEIFKLQLAYDGVVTDTILIEKTYDNNSFMVQSLYRDLMDILLTNQYTIDFQVSEVKLNGYKYEMPFNYEYGKISFEKGSCPYFTKEENEGLTGAYSSHNSDLVSLVYKYPNLKQLKVFLEEELGRLMEQYLREFIK